MWASAYAFSCSVSPCSGYLGTVSGSTMTAVATVPHNATPGHVAVSPYQVAFVDTSHGGLGVYDKTSNSTVLLPLSRCAEQTGSGGFVTTSIEIGGIAFDANATPWVNCVTQPLGSATPAPLLVHLVLTRTWQLFPPAAFSCGGNGFIGIGGAQPSDSFTVREPERLAMRRSPATTPCWFPVPTCGSTPNSGRVTVTETNSGRSQTVSLSAYTAGIVHATRRGYRTHPR